MRGHSRLCLGVAIIVLTARPARAYRHSMIHLAHENRSFRLSWSHGSYPPYLELDESGAYYGLMVDILDLVCEELGMKFSLVQAKWSMPFGDQGGTDYGSYVEFAENATDAMFGLSPELVTGYGENRTTWGQEAVRLYEKGLPRSPIVELYSDHFTALLRKTSRPVNTWQLFKPFGTYLHVYIDRHTPVHARARACMHARQYGQLTSFGVGSLCLSPYQASSFRFLIHSARCEPVRSRLQRTLYRQFSRRSIILGPRCLVVKITSGCLSPEESFASRCCSWC